MTMTIANGLKELKHIDKRILKKTSEIERLCAGQSNQVPKYGDDQQEHVTKLIQSTKDLIQRKMDIKLAITKKNVETVVSFRKREYSLQEILFLRESGLRGQSIADLIKRLFSALHSDDRVEIGVKSINDRNAGEKDAPKVEIIRYFDIDKRDREEEEFDRLLQELDYLIEEANFRTLIDINPPEED